MATTWPPSWPPAAAELHIFDPDGDVLLILTRSNNEESNRHYAEKKAPILINIDKDAKNDAADSVTRIEDDIDSEQRFNSNIPKDNAIEPTLTRKIISKTDVHMRACSKVLSLVSCVFRRMFGPDFKEGATLKSHGSVTILLPDDDPDCLVILLNIIHGMTRKVPRSLENPDILVGLATLIDYYKLHEVAELFSDAWLTALSGDDARKHVGYGCHHLLQDLWISWVFQDSSAFKDISRSLIVTGKEGFNDYKDPEIMQEMIDRLPIPPTLTSIIKSRRNTIILWGISQVHELIKQYSGSCDALVLGCLIKGARQAQIWPRPTEPYKFSYEAMAIALKNLEIHSLCRKDNTGSLDHQDAHDIASHITRRPVVLDYWFRPPNNGLNIGDFLPRDKKRKRR